MANLTNSIYGRYYCQEYTWVIEKSSNKLSIIKHEEENNDSSRDIDVTIIWKNWSAEGQEYLIQHTKQVIIKSITIYDSKDRYAKSMKNTITESKCVNLGTDYFYETVVRTLENRIGKQLWTNRGDFIVSAKVSLSYTISNGSDDSGYVECTEFKNISLNLKKLIMNDKYCDIKLVVSGKELLANKNILAAHSSVFDKMFSTNMKENIENKVIIDDVSYETFEKVLRLLYGENICI